MQICELTDSQCERWDAYVRTSPQALPQHLSGWRKVMKQSYGYETRYLLATEAASLQEAQPEHIVGVLPLFFVRSPLTGQTAMTMPGGLCADHEDIAIALLDKAQTIAAEMGMQRLVVQDARQPWPCTESSILAQTNVTTEQRHVAWLLELHGAVEEVEQRLDRNIRRQIRMAQRNDLQVEIAADSALLEPFYDLWCRFTRQMGTPVFGRQFLQSIIETFPNDFNIALVRHQQQVIGGYFQLQVGKTMLGVWGGALHEFLALRPVYLAYGNLLRYAVEQGFQRLDMGRSPLDSPASDFKKQWGGKAVPIYQHRVNLQQPPHLPLGQTHQTFHPHPSTAQRYFTQLWRNLPLPFTQFVGPILRRHIPFG
ncbi:MAG: GNAT family N-acetyltransferase [Caldilineaceae bacterium]